MISSLNILKSVLESIPSKPTIMLGYWTEIANDLVLMGLDKSKDGTKFPLIVVNTFAKYETGTVVRETSFKNIKFYIINEASETAGFIDRVSSTYENSIIPLRDEMLHTMVRSKKFNLSQKDNLLEFEREEQMFPFLLNEGKSQNKTNEVVDTLELTFKELRIKTLK